MDAKRSLVRKWMTKARRDLLSAKRLARGKEPYFDTAIYHCQQAVEKSVKGWLVYNDQGFEKTHDLRLLVTQASEVEPKFASWFDSQNRSPHMQPRIVIQAKSWNQQRLNSSMLSKSRASSMILYVRCFRLN